MGIQQLGEGKQEFRPIKGNPRKLKGRPSARDSYLMRSGVPSSLIPVSEKALFGEFKFLTSILQDYNLTVALAPRLTLHSKKGNDDKM